MIILTSKYLNVEFADAKDQKSIDLIVEKSKVVLSAMGPYKLYGTSVIDACVRKGADYCDITGETAWVREMIEKYHKEAEQKGILIGMASQYMYYSFYSSILWL